MLYAALDAPFLFAVQIIVYTGAILMLFLFVLMLVGVDASDSVVETIRGQRVLAIAAGVLLGTGLVIGLGQISLGTAVGLDEANAPGNIQALADILFSRYVFAFETTSALLITAAVGAMVLRPPRASDPEAAAARARRPAGPGLRREGHAPRSAAASGRLRPPQRGRHPGPAARRHRGRDLGLAGAGRAWHHPVGARDRRPSTRSRSRSAGRRTPGAAAGRSAGLQREEAPATGGEGA